MRIKLLNIDISRSVFRNSLFISTVIVGFLILFNVFTVSLLKHELNQNLDNSLTHEMENISNAVRIENGSLIITNQNEFLEADLIRITDNPFFLQIYDTKGNLLLNSKNIILIPPITKRVYNFSENIYFEDDTAGNKEIRAAYKKLIDGRGVNVGFMQLSTTKARLTVITKNVLIFNLISFPVLLLFIIIISFIISKRTYSPINKIISTAKTISATNLKERINYEADPEDEIGQLRDTLNDLFERLEFQVKQISSFTDNASHQLMNPLTAINSELDFLLSEQNSIDERNNSVIIIKEETGRMIKIVKSLLLLAKDSNTLFDQKHIFNLSKIVKESVKKIYKEKKIEIEIDPDIYLRGNPDYFSIALQNLIDNAKKYSNEDWVTLTAAKSDDKIVLRIEDFGVGISDEEKEKVFDKFYRSENVEILGIKGYGLGLSLVKLIITAMNGSIEIKDNTPKGSIFIITLPAVNLQ